MPADSGEDHIRDSRDERWIASEFARGRSRFVLRPAAPLGSRGGGARVADPSMRRAAVIDFRPGREDAFPSVRRGYAAYRFPGSVLAGPGDGGYVYFRIAAGPWRGWRMAVPRGTGPGAVRVLLARVARYGPRAAGVVRWGDTLVPAALSPGAQSLLGGRV